MNKKITKIVLSLSAITLSLSSVTSAQASTPGLPSLPSGDVMYGISCSGSPDIWSISNTASATPATVTNSDYIQCSDSGAYNPVNHKFYFIENGNYPRLFSFDPATSSVQLVHDLTGPGQGNGSRIAIDSQGHAFVMEPNMFGPNGANWYSIDLATAQTALLGNLGSGNTNGAVAFNPADGLIYFFSGNNIGVIDSSTGVSTTVHTVSSWAQGACPSGSGTSSSAPGISASFDSNGIAWIKMSGGCRTDIEAWDPQTNASWYAGTVIDGTHTVVQSSPYTFSVSMLMISFTPRVAPAPSSSTPTSSAPTLATTGAHLESTGLVVLTAFGLGILCLCAVRILKSRRKSL